MVVLFGLSLLSGNAGAAERRLDAQSIKNAVIGHMVSVFTPERTIDNIRLVPGGAIVNGKDNDKKIGTWSVSGGLLCFEFPNAIDHICTTVIEHSSDKSRLYLFTVAGESFGEIRFHKDR